MTAWRFRRCPSCQSVYAAGRFRPVRFDVPWTGVGRVERQCPGCDHRAPTAHFEVVREYHPVRRLAVKP
jgi:hypothetical protein